MRSTSQLNVDFNHTLDIGVEQRTTILTLYQPQVWVAMIQMNRWKPNFSHHRFIYFCFIILVIFMNSSLYVTQISLDQEVGSIAVSQMPNQIWYWNKENFYVGPFFIHILWQQFCLGFSFSYCYKTFSTLFCGTKSREDFTPTSLWCLSTCIIWGIEPT